MTRKLLTLALISIICCGCNTTEKISPVPFNKVELTDGFWKAKVDTVISVTVPFSLQQSETAINRFRQCIDFIDGASDVPAAAHRFISSDMYKVLEGAAYSLMTRPDKEIEDKIDYIAELISKVQRPDGYLYISHICGNPIVSEMGPKPYSYVVHSHELYNMGHLYEAAVAYFQATGKDNLLKIAEKHAEHVNKVFFEGDPAYNDGKPINQAPGHQEIELALCKLYRCTGKKMYLDMAKKFLDIRGITYVPEGEGTMHPEYAQQHSPVALQRKPAGHAVRAGYMYTGMAQVDALTGRGDYTEALESIWNNLVSTRMHITGGLGAVREVEGFGAEYELPNRNAYDETCAAVANIFFNEGMFLASGDAKYLDIAEASIYNNALAGINLAGNRFFYVNPLEADGEWEFNHGVAGRTEWFDCACCPPNISRMILQSSGYMYAYTSDEIFLTMYGGSKTTIPLKKGNVYISQISDYPFSGKATVNIEQDKAMRYSVKLRIPTWAGQQEFLPGGLYTYENGCDAVEIRINGEKTAYTMQKGFAVIDRTWKSGDRIELSLPMDVRYVKCDERVTDNIGHLAVTRGPLVYCAEEADNIRNLDDLQVEVSDHASVENLSDGILSGIPMIHCNDKVNLIPYYAWNNRGDAQTMRVWLKRK